MNTNQIICFVDEYEYSLDHIVETTQVALLFKTIASPTREARETLYNVYLIFIISYHVVFICTCLNRGYGWMFLIPVDITYAFPSILE